MAEPGRLAPLVLVLGAILTGTAVWSATHLEPEVDFVDTVPEHAGLAPYRALLQELDGVRFVAVYMAHDTGTGTDSLRGEAFDALVAEQADLTQRFEQAHPGAFTHSLSAYEGMRTGNYMLAKVATAGNPPDSAYALPQDPITWQLVKDQILGDDTLHDVLAADGSSALLLVFLATDDAAEARGLAGQMGETLAAWSRDASNHPVTDDHAPSGLLWASHVTDERNRDEMRQWTPVAVVAVAIAMLWVARGPVNAGIAVVSLLAAFAWTLGLMAAFSIKVSFLTFVLAPLVIAIGVDHAIHVLHRYEEERTAGRSKRYAVQAAMRQTRAPVLIAAATTASGLAVLLLVPAPLFAQIGGVAALGIVLSALAAMTLVPALRSVAPASPPKRAPHSRLEGWAKAGRAKRILSLLAILLVTGAAGWIAADQTRIESGSSENEFPQDDPTIVLQHRIEAEYGAFQRAYLVVQGDLTDPAALAAIHRATNASATLPLYHDAASIADILLADEATDDGAIDIAMAAVLGISGQAPSDAERLPQTRDEARDRLDALFEDPLWRGIAPFTISRDYDLAIVAIQVQPWQDQAELRSLRDALLAHAESLQRELPDHAVAAAGAPMNRAAIIDQTPDDVRIAILGTAAVVGIVLLVAWARHGWSGVGAALGGTAIVLVAALWLLATIPILDHVHGWLAAAGAPENSAALNDMFLIAFAVTVAVGIDDLVHLAERFWQARRDGEGRQQALETSFRTAGRAVTGTTLTTFVGFAAFSGIYFLQSKNLAILTASGVAFAYLLTIVVTPWLLGKPLRRPAVPVPDES